MSVAEKVCCYPFDANGTESAFEMVRAYFEKINMNIGFYSVYEEARLLSDYYEKQKAEEFIKERAKQAIGAMELLEINMEQQKRYEVFDRIYTENMQEKKDERDMSNDSDAMVLLQHLNCFMERCLEIWIRNNSPLYE